MREPAFQRFGHAEDPTGLDIRNGLHPREPLYPVVAPAVVLAGRLVPGSDMVAPPLGFRIEESMLMMAARSFGDWTRDLPSRPGAR